MRYIAQLSVIMLFTYGSEVLVKVLNIPFPGSILGMLLLFTCLKLGVIKLGAVREAGDYLLAVLPIMFVPLGVGIMEYADVMSEYGGSIAAIVVISTILVMVITGWTVQFVMGKAGDDHAA